MIGAVDKVKRQRGVTLFGLLFWAVVVGFVALIGMRVLPALNEFFTIKRTVNKIAGEGATVPRSGRVREAEGHRVLDRVDHRKGPHDHQGKRQGGRILRV
jgi:hypothetical protein